MPKPRKRRDKAYRPRAVKDTTYLLTEREPPSISDATTLKIVYSQIYERVRTGAADERDLWSMAALLEKLHIAVEYSDELDDKETTYTQLREAYNHIKHAIDHGRRVLSGEGLQMLRDALYLNHRLIDHSSEYILKQIVRVLATRASTGQFKVAQTPITDAEMFVG